MKTRSLLSISLALALPLAGCMASTSPVGHSSAAVRSNDFNYTVNPLHQQVATSDVSPNVTSCHGGAIGCYSPGPMRAAYDVPNDLDGTGQTIVIVDAFGSPTINHDLAVFDAVFGLPAPPSFTTYCPAGCPAFNPNDPHDPVGWSYETTLDVEWAHAIAPGARIVLVVAPTSSGSAINAAEAQAIQRYPGSVMSQSFGIPEFAITADNTQILQAIKNYQAARDAGITVLASAGDSGATNGIGVANAGFPASDPLNTAVGGTQGNPYPFGLVSATGTYGGEEVWNEGPPILGGYAATGGAPSLIFGAPDFQKDLGLATRAIPDVSYNAAVDGGVLVYWSALSQGAGFYLFGGTSAGSPQWAGIVALANQANGAPLGDINPALYSLASNPATYARDFHDVTTGNNQLGGTPVGFNATEGWDDATGLGTPNVANLIQDLVATANQ